MKKSDIVYRLVMHFVVTAVRMMRAGGCTAAGS